MSVITRFPPSPTGFMHIGNARTALITWLFARNLGGRFILRIDDTDTERSEEAFVEAIARDLSWLGLDWDDRVRQSDRAAAYDGAIARLKADGRLYPCYETPEELSLKRRTQLSRGRPPIYDRAALAQTAAERAGLEAEGRRPHWRFKLDHAAIAWDDLVRGPVHFEGGDLSDPVLIREDGRPLYHLCSVVDDIELGVTHVVRGEDHVANTATHVQMAEALGARPPAFAHLPLIADAEGKSLSKRLGSLSLAWLREEDGLEPLAIASVRARLGTSDASQPAATLETLVAGFDFSHFGRASPRLDPEEFRRINAKLLHTRSHAEVADGLARLGADDVDAAFWQAVRPNLERLRDVADWWRVTHGPVAPAVDDPDFAAAAARLLPEEPWDDGTWAAWVASLKAETGRQGKALFMPLRRALTGMDHGPELKVLLPLIGRQRVLERLGAHAAAAPSP